MESSDKQQLNSSANGVAGASAVTLVSNAQESKITSEDSRLRHSVERLSKSRVASAVHGFIRVAVTLHSLICRHIALTTFVIAAAVLAWLTPYGLDPTDTGFHLANQDMLPVVGWGIVGVSPLWWFSDVLGGAWLLLTDHWGLLGARLGWALAIAATTAIGVRAVANVYGPSVWLVAGGALAVLHSAAIPVMVLDYYIVPSLFSVLFVLVYLQAIQAEKISKILWSSLAGFLLFLVIISRLPASLLLTVPFVHLAWLLSHQADERRRAAVTIPTVTIGTAILGLVLCMMALAAAGVLHSYISGIIGDDLVVVGEKETDRFSFAKLEDSYFLTNATRQVRMLAPYGIGLMTLLTILIEGVRRNMHWLPVTIIGVVYATGIFLFIPELSVGEGRYYIFVLLFGAACIAFGWRDIAYLGPASEARFVLLIASLIVPVTLDAGSSLGLLKLCYGGALLFSLAVALAREAIQLAPARICRITLALALLVLGGVALERMSSHLAQQVYGDTARSTLTAEMHSQRLRHVWTRPGRQKSFDALVDVVERESRPGDRIFAYSNVALISYAARRSLIFDALSDFLQPLELASRLTRLCSERLPALIVRTRGSLMNAEWGSVEKPLDFPLPSFERSHQQMDAAVASRCRTELLWFNRDFEVLRPSAP